MKPLLIGLLCVPFIGMGQTYQLPDIIPPSPQAAEFIKYIDFPMNLSSGLPSINIPVYTIESQELSLPISLSYHASGLKPNQDESGIVGLGWHLNAFGIVSRSINKQPDERFSSYIIPMEGDISNDLVGVRTPDAEILDNIVKGYHAESTPDLFSYTLPTGESGNFILKRGILSEFLNPIVLPFKAVKIVPNLSGETFEYFDVKDESGVLYRFGKSISTNQEVHEKYYNYNNLLENGITSWLLTEIISSDKSDTIFFEYNDVINSSGQTDIFESRHTFVRSASVTQSGPGNIVQENDTGITDAWSAHVYTQKKITRIRFKSGTVRFIYKSDVYPDHLLDGIEIYRKESGTPVKKITFNQTKYHNSSGLLNWYKLDELSFYDDNNTKINKYNFLYNDALNFPQIHYNGTKETYSVDFWGYYNGAPNSNLMPFFNWTCPYPNGPNIFGSANRNPNKIFSETGVLKKITNPTAGETIFEYEGNKNNSDTPIGGLRIKSITHRTDGKEIKRSFTYYGISKTVNADYFVSHSNNTSTSSNTITDVFTATSEPNCNLNIGANPVLYTKVTEFFGSETTNSGWIEHIFDAPFTASNVYYHYLHYNGYPWIFEGTDYSYGPLPVYYNDIVLGSIFERETRIFDASGNPVRTTKNYYSHPLKQRVHGFNVSRAVNIPESDMYLYDRPYFYHYYNYRIDQLSQRLDSTTVTEYSTEQPLTRREKYSYNNSLLITEKKTQKSDGSWNISKYKYPNDFITQAPYDVMVNDRNIISPVVEQLDYKGTIPLQSVKTNYRDWGSYVIAADSVEAKTGTNPYEVRLKYHSYDNSGNVLSVSQDDGPRLSYLWGYNETYPVAKVINARESQIAFASFENAKDKGGWTYAPDQNPPTQRKTGNYSFQGTSISKNSLPSGKYTIGYWAKKSGASDGMVTINANATTISGSDWEYKEFTTESAVTSISITLSGVLIDELRLCPEDAQMTTYTYNALLGVTSQTDPGGQVTTFEYDSFGRLQTVRDTDENILKYYQYHYKE